MRGRILLQDLVTRRYFADDKTWVTNCQHATAFEHTYIALLEGLNHREIPSQIVWCLGDPAMNLFISVRPDNFNATHTCDSCPLCKHPANP